jgi:tetratricopeptide (TPR) repeat protein
VALTGFTHAWQTWNNCGPTTISTYLSYYGLQTTQAQAAAMLKPNADDKNVSPEELAGYARAQGLEALVRLNGDITLLQTLLSNGFPVIVETWLDPEDRGGLGHYRLLSGYDQASDSFIAQDSLRGPNAQVPADEFDGLWRVFNRKYVLAFPPEEGERLRAILGAEANDGQMLGAALQRAQAEARQISDDPYAWFNIGSIYVAQGEMELAAGAFDEARRIGLPYRMLWYQFEPFEAYLALERYEEVIDLATAVLQGTGGLEELYYYRGVARQALGEQDSAARDFEAALDYNPLYIPATLALQSNITPAPAPTDP